MSEYKIFVQRIGLIGITNILIAISSLILLPIITKNISINDYGLWVQVNVTILLVSNLITLGLPYAMVRFLAAKKVKSEIQEGFYSILLTILILALILSFILYIYSQPIANILFNGNITVAIILPLIIIVVSVNNILLSYFRTFQQMKKYSVILFIQAYLIVILLSYFVISNYGIIGIIIGLLITYCIVFLIMIIFIILDIGLKIPKFSHIEEYLSFSLPTVPSNLSFWVVDSSDRYIIGILLGTAFVGYYSPGYTLGNTITMLLVPFSTLLPAVLSKYHDENKINEVKTVLSYSLKYFLILAIPSVVGISLLSKPLLMVLTTPEIATNGYLVTPFVAISALFSGLYGIYVLVIILEKKTKVIGIVWIIAAILNILFNILLIPYFGIIGAAFVTLIAYVTTFVIIFYYSSKYVHIDFNFGLIKIILSSIIMSLFIIYSNPSGILNIFLVIGISFVIYMLSLIILGGIKKEEFKFIKESFKR
ncbi:MAG: polysaccharide biosynthesis C-terminal domain-containing protein [Methanobacteriaceae archaeon]|nr:polysaccharide biosynthesis C-terminal domain-containing protein [Methanobacteriaceae archaeon]